MFSKVLIANRGEIAVRVIRTLRRLGIASVAVYSDADAGAPHVRAAGEAVRIGPPPAAHSYLSIEAIIAAARATGAQAVHPGYGFLAENARFARACAAAGLTFIGPPPEAIEAMGDKIAAKATVSAAGVPVVPGAGAPGLTDQQLISAINDTWYPVLVKPSAGGGGKGMRVARTPAELPEALASARREARAAFADDTLLVEKYIDSPRHIEIQVLADSHGTVIHLGERECSLQRRHQKVIEEAPSPLLDHARRTAMGAAAVEAARSAGYVGAGTVECIVDGGNPDAFYFMEMNTRLQVEHPVTELVTGLDLVEWQIRVAAGEQLPFADAPVLSGHAVEARVYAEDPARDFLPTGGKVLVYSEPQSAGWVGRAERVAGGYGGSPPRGGAARQLDALAGFASAELDPGPTGAVRIDSGIDNGSVVTSAYDPMLAKVVAWGPDRPTALRRLDAALRETVILGVTTNIAFLRGLLADPDVQAGRLDTGLIERLRVRDDDKPVPREVLAAAALVLVAGGEATAVTDPWDIADGWRVGERAWTRLRLAAGPAKATDVRVRALAAAGAQLSPGGATPRSIIRTPRGAPDERAMVSGAQVAIGDDEPVAVGGEWSGNELLVEVDEKILTFRCALDGRTVWLGRDGLAWALTEVPAAGKRGGATGAADGTVRSPMPGTVLAVRVSAGDAVAAGQPLAVIEAMKMEHAVTAPLAGIVAELPVRAGQQVQMDETLAVIKEASHA